MAEINLITIGIIAVLIGVILVVAGIVSQAKGKTNVRGGGVVLIGPIPIIFGTDSKMAQIAAIAGVMLLLAIIAFYFLRR